MNLHQVEVVETVPGAGMELALVPAKELAVASTSKSPNRVQLNGAQKQEICRLHQNNPSMSHDDIQRTFEQTSKLQVGRSTITKILKEKEKWLMTDYEAKPEEGKRKKQRFTPFLSLETALFTWFCQKRESNKTVMDAHLRQKAKQLAKESGISEDVFKASDGWLHNFKKRNHIKLYSVTGDADDVDQAVGGRPTALLRKAIHELGFDAANVFNFSETGLSFRSQPNKTLATSPVKGKKLQKDRITVGLCLNATGEEKLKMVVVYRSRQPRCFSGFNPEGFCHYYYNQSAWMTAEVFQDWIGKLNREMSLKGRKILVLLENSSSHAVAGHERLVLHTYQVIHFAAVTLLFLPTNCESVIQPLDAGCIATFKLYYKRHFLSWCIDDLESSQQQGAAASKTKSLANVDQAITWAKLAWDDLQAQTIRNCWRKVNIVSSEWNSEITYDEKYEHMTQAEEHHQHEIEGMCTGQELVQIMRDAVDVKASRPLEAEQPQAQSPPNDQLHEADLHGHSSVTHGEPDEDADVRDQQATGAVPIDDARRMLQGCAQFMAENGQAFTADDHSMLQRLCYKVNKEMVASGDEERHSRMTTFFQ